MQSKSNPTFTMTTSALITLSFFFLLFSCATCFNISKILENYPDFQTYNNYLNQTKINLEINSRRTITVLVVDNGAMGSISSSDPDNLKDIMRLHVLLDYYDKAKIKGLLSGGSDVPRGDNDATTLYQTTGKANALQGHMMITYEKGGGYMIGSAMKYVRPNARFVREVFTEPYNISVMQISDPIYVPGVQNISHSTPAPPSPPPSKEKSPKAAPSEAPDADSPSADAPSADSPDADRAPGSSPSPSPDADAPGDDSADSPEGSNDKEADSSAGARVSVGACVGAVVVAVSSWVALL